MAVDVAGLTVEWKSDHGDVGWIQLFPSNPLVGGTINIVEISETLDLGVASLEDFMEPRVMLHGQNYYGGVYSEARDITIPLLVRTAGAAAGMDWTRIVQGWFPSNAMGKLRFSRETAGGDPVVSILRCTALSEISSWRRAFDGDGAGAIGRADSGFVAVPLRLRAPKPLFRDESPTTSDLLTVVAGTTGVIFITNNCPHEIGARISASGTFTGLTALNATTGRGLSVSQTVSAPQTLAVDWFASDEDEIAVTLDGGGDYVEQLNYTAKLTLLPGVNQIEVDLGTGTADVEVMYWGSYGSL